MEERNDRRAGRSSEWECDNHLPPRPEGIGRVTVDFDFQSEYADRSSPNQGASHHGRRRKQMEAFVFQEIEEIDPLELAGNVDLALHHHMAPPDDWEVRPEAAE
jgi:hypothetical protein